MGHELNQALDIELADWEGMGRPYMFPPKKELKRTVFESDLPEIIRANGDGMILRVPVEE